MEPMENNIDVHLGKRLRRRRRLLGLTQQQLAELTGISVSLVSRLEGGMLPDVGMLRLLSLLNCVGLEIQLRPRNHRRTLDDVAEELNAEALKDPATNPPERQRVRHTRAEKAPKTAHLAASGLGADRSGCPGI